MGQGNRKLAFETNYETLAVSAIAPVPPPGLSEPPTSLVAAEKHDALLVEYMMAYIKYVMETTIVPMHNYYGQKQELLYITLLTLHTESEYEVRSCCGGNDTSSKPHDLQGRYVSSKYFDENLFRNVFLYQSLVRQLADQPTFVVNCGYYQSYKCTPKSTHNGMYLDLERCEVATSSTPTETVPSLDLPVDGT